MQAAEALDMLWILISTALVFFMQAGFACLEAGVTRSKNSINVAIKNLTDLVLSCLTFWLVGYGLMFGASSLGIVGTNHFVFSLENWHENYKFLFQMVFCGTATTILSGAVAERMAFSGYLIATIVNSLLVYPVFGHWVWNGDGWLAQLGFVDFAGSTVVHSIGGWVALAAILVIGPRTGRFNEDGSVNKINGSNLPVAVLGALILWFGWIGFNGGSVLAFNESIPGVIINTIIGGAAGGFAAIFTSWYLRKRPECEPLVNGSLAGLVAVTANCHAIAAWEAIVIGAVGGLLMLVAESLLLRWRVDDAVGAIPVHLVAGMWGTVAVAFFADPTILGSDQGSLAQAGIQLLGVSIAGLWAFGISYTFFRLLNRWIPLRVSQDHEHLGLNAAEHGATTEILDLFTVMDKQQRTSDFSLRVPEEPFTEIGQIAKKYNAVLSTVQRHSEELSKAKHKTDAILQSLGEGLLVINSDGTLAHECSAMAQTLLNSEEIEGRYFSELLFPKGSVLDQESLRHQIESLVATAFELFIPEQFETLIKNAPKTIKFPIQTDGACQMHSYRLNFAPIIEEGSIVRLILVITDETELDELRSSVSGTYRKIASTIQHIQSLARADEQNSAFVRSLGELSKLSQEVSDDIGHVTIDNVDRIFRSLHTIKGGVRLFNLDFLQHFAHEAETMLADVRDGRRPLESLDHGQLRDMVSTLKEGVGCLQQLVPEASSPQSQSADDVRRNFQHFLAMTQRSVESFAAELQKDIQFHMESSIALSDMDTNLLQLCLIHTVRNAMDHGIETAAKRRLAKKSTTGSITVDISSQQDLLEVKISDDGGGVDIERVCKKAIERGLLASQHEGLSLDQLCEVLCHPGFSTRDDVTEISGRGVGMDAVAHELKQHGGQISLQQSSTTGTTWLLQWRPSQPPVSIHPESEKVA